MKDLLLSIIAVVLPISIVIFLSLIAVYLCSCTVSFQNIHTEGYAQDLVDENQTTDPSTQLSIPSKL